MVGMLLRHYYAPIPILLYSNTAIIIGLTFAVTWRATVLMMDALRRACPSLSFCERWINE